MKKLFILLLAFTLQLGLFAGSTTVGAKGESLPAPLCLSAGKTGAGVTLQWYPPYAQKYNITKYEISFYSPTYNDYINTFYAQGDQTTFFHNALPKDGSDFVYEVRSLSEGIDGEFYYSRPTNAVTVNSSSVIAAPCLTYSYNKGWVNLKWLPPVEGKAVKYKVVRKGPGSNKVDFSVEAPTTTLQDKPPYPTSYKDPYIYYVRAIDDNENISSISNIIYIYDY